MRNDITLNLARHPYTVHLPGRLVHFSSREGAISFIADLGPTDPPVIALTYGSDATALAWEDDVEAERERRRRYGRKVIWHHEDSGEADRVLL